ncbi:substrate-binding periplasmic protein [Vibrio anguillarum]|uniref:substrate-binding periplasmic protein n=1 Tax=Vibrio anguillarum TaxID=55601 RepID=UPI001AD82AD7
MKQMLLILWLLIIPSMSRAEIKLVTLDYPPYITQDKDKLDGVAVRLLRDIFQQIDTPIKINILPWGRAISYVENGTADAIFTAFKTPEREKFADYNNEVLFNQNIIIIRPNVSHVIWDKSNIKELSICLVNNVSYGTWLDSMLAQNNFKAIYKVNSAEQCVLMLLSNRVDFWVNNEFGARYIAAQMGVTNDIYLETPPLESTPSYIAFSKKNQHLDLVKKIDHTLRTKKDNAALSGEQRKPPYLNHCAVNTKFKAN